MNTTSILQRTLQALLITGVSIFGLAPAHAEDAVKVTANNYVRAESDILMTMSQTALPEATRELASCPEKTSLSGWPCCGRSLIRWSTKSSRSMASA